MDEAAIVVQVVNDLLAPGDLTPEDIGVISPYAGQVRLIRSMVGDVIEGLEVKSVDGYQGREKEIIVLSTVRANDAGKVGFLSNYRRLNVALTRAKRGLIVIGDDRTLRNDPTWASWLDWISESNLMAWHVVNS
jgi:regulator of nonsense transcripts 1